MEKDIFNTKVLILKDVIRFLWRSFIATILVAVCIQNGWIGAIAHEVSHEMFWQIYSCFIPIIVIIMGYKGISGKYNCEIYKTSILGCQGYAVQEKKENSTGNKITMGFR